jgi:hypothetical protein
MASPQMWQELPIGLKIGFSDIQEGIFPIHNFFLQHHSGKIVGQVDS